MRAMPPLRALQAFETTARHSSVTAAAVELHVTPSAVSHQIRALEAHLGLQLFHRTNRRVVLSDAGRNYLQLVTSAFDRIDAATRELVGHGFTDVLTVHCAPTFAPAWLMPRLPDFLERHSDIDIRINATPEPADFTRGTIDVEIRYGDGDWPGFKVIPLMREEIAPLCSPAFLNTHLPAQPHPTDLVGLRLIHSERSLVSWRAWADVNGVPDLEVRRGLRFDRGYLSIQAALDGLGIALESDVFAARELARGDLVKPFAGAAIPIEVSAHHLVYPSAYRDVPKVRKFRTWITEHAAAG
jgi:LysR family transcriptional regulator, glycine cleavage system transcriptional activator